VVGVGAEGEIEADALAAVAGMEIAGDLDGIKFSPFISTVERIEAVGGDGLVRVDASGGAGLIDPDVEFVIRVSAGGGLHRTAADLGAVLRAQSPRRRLAAWRRLDRDETVDRVVGIRGKGVKRESMASAESARPTRRRRAAWSAWDRRKKRRGSSREVGVKNQRDERSAAA